MACKSVVYKKLVFVLSSVLLVFLGSSSFRSSRFSLFQSIPNSPVADTLFVYDSLSEKEKRFPEFAVAGLDVAEGLEATLFASEPTISNPTSIDVDHRGRVWVCDSYNYRPTIHGEAKTRSKQDRLAGDRILILEDTDGDGKSDVTKVFYQGPELDAPLGICVIGNRVIVSQSPYVWLFTDDDGDDKADRKEIIFRGVSGARHDQGIHSFVFGPDGKVLLQLWRRRQAIARRAGPGVL